MTGQVVTGQAMIDQAMTNQAMTNQAMTNQAMISQAMIDQAMTNQALVSEFEQGHAPGAFHHADHVRVAFAYVSEFPLLGAIAKFSAALKRFALAKGKPDLYHQTITWAYLLLIHERIARGARAQSGSAQSSSVQSWEEFSQRNPDLLLWKGGVLERYYSKATLESEFARRTFVFPAA